jgi:phosphohistidine phosphatase
MKLYLAQHGEACSKEIDPERPLTSKGMTEIERLAGFLKQAGVRADKVVHSGKLRATQTAERLANAIAPGIELQTSSEIDPNNSPQPFALQIASWTLDTLVVGHLPFMAKLVSHLTVGDEEALIAAFQPGSILCLERTDKGFWQIDWMIRPDCLRNP